MHDGQIHLDEPSALYRALPVEAVEDLGELMAWVETGEWPKKKTVKEFLAPLIREIVREELDAQAEGKGKCAWCEGEFPESALNHSSVGPACGSCQEHIDRRRRRG